MFFCQVHILQAVSELAVNEEPSLCARVATRAVTSAPGQRIPIFFLTHPHFTVPGTCCVLLLSIFTELLTIMLGSLPQRLQLIQKPSVCQSSLNYFFKHVTFYFKFICHPVRTITGGIRVVSCFKQSFGAFPFLSELLSATQSDISLFI